MKFVKRITALFLAMVMVMAMGINVAAATVTVTDSTGLQNHTYTAYQVFSGKWDSTSKKLSDIQWGSAITDSSAFLTALKADTTIGAKFTSASTAEQVADIVATFQDNGADAVAFSKVVFAQKTGNGSSISTSTTTLADGYYLIVDSTSISAGSDDVKNLALLQVAGNDITIGNKNSKPSVEKKVKENVKSIDTSDYTAQYNDVADYSIGDDVPFQLIGTVPNITNYTVYSYTFNDTLDKSFTAPETSAVKVWLSSDKKHTAGDSDTDITSNFTITVDSTNNTITVAANVVKNADGTYTSKGLKDITGLTQTGGQFIIVDYSAKLNSGAVIGLNGNVNKVDLTYSNNPNQGGEGETGKTPEDKVIVFTYELDVTKANGKDKNAQDYTTLKDAKFRLYKMVGDTKTYAQVDSNWKVTGWTTTESQGTELVSGENGIFKVIGLDDGTYYLNETAAPAGYNKLTTDITLVISATTANGQSWSGTASDALTALTLKVDSENAVATTDSNKGKVETTVVNKSGSTLPSTGGMGTTILYVAGIAMIVVAGVVVIARKRNA